MGIKPRYSYAPILIGALVIIVLVVASVIAAHV